MRVTAKIIKASSIEATITLTARIEQWEQLAEFLKDAPWYGVSGDLKSAIGEMSRKVSEVFLYDTEDEGK